MRRAAERRRRRIVGLLPRVGQHLSALGQRTFAHPQPFLVLGVVVVMLWGLAIYAQRSEAFRLAHVTCPESSGFKLPSSLIGTNLWELNIQKLSEDLKRQQPWLKEVRVIRQLPSGIRIDPIARIPVARVRQAGRWYPVDDEGVILPEALSDGSETLVRLTGLTRTGMSLRAEKANADEQLKRALRILGTLRRASALISRRVSEINVADPQQIRFVLDDGTDVRCGSEAELGAHLDRLKAVLKVIAKRQLTVHYIDVRFQEPVVGPRT